jgi:AcrR family transcriptional regulator
MSHVRILNKHPASAEKKPQSLRKKPIQSRAQFTLAALQESFVRVLVERGYEKMTIREVAAVAGIGVGTFYDYVPNLRALAASTIHKRCMDTAAHLQNTVTEQEGQDIRIMVKALLQALVREGFGKPQEWTALLMLERQVSSAAALRKIHESYVQVWAQAIRLSSVQIQHDQVILVARMAHSLSYGWYSHDLLFYIDDPKHSRSITEIGSAIVGIIELASD